MLFNNYIINLNIPREWRYNKLMKKFTFLITARLKSKRLPKKVLLKVLGKPLIVHMINRIKYAKNIDKIIICTSTNVQDDPLEEIANQEKINCYRGSEDDVLQRLLDAAKKFNLNHFANLTADVPMIDPFLIDESVEKYNDLNVDLILPEKNSFGACYVFKVSALEKVCKTKKETDTEIWMKYFTSHKKLKIHIFKVNSDKKHKFLKTSLDYYEDYKFIQKIFEELYRPNKVFANKDIINLVKKNPYISKINNDWIHLQRYQNHIENINKK